MSKKFDKAYKRLDRKGYKEIIRDTLIPLFDPYDGTYQATLRESTVFTMGKMFYGDIKLGWNIYADGKLIATKSTKKKARKYIEKLINNGGRQ